MIQEIINFVKDLENDYPEVFELNKTPSPGLHFWVELDEKGNWKNNPPVEGKDYVVYDGQEKLQKLHYKAVQYSEFGRTVGGVTDTNKCLDLPAKKIHSCSPFIISFRKKEFSNVTERINVYFEKATCVCLEQSDELGLQKAIAFKNNFQDYLNFVQSLQISITEKTGEQKTVSLIDTFKDDYYINFYLNNIDLNTFKLAHDNYLKEKIFNTNKYNFSGGEDGNLYGLSNYINGANSKKTFLEHKTATMHKGISSRILASDAAVLNQFEILQSNRVLPNPLPIFIDKNEFKNNSEIVSIFNNEGERKFSYAQLLKKVYEKDEQRILGNYYLLNISRGVINDFDFVSNFQYKVDLKIENFFEIKQKGEKLPTTNIHTIFGFENIVVVKIFNNALVTKYGDKGFGYKYFDEIKVKDEDGGESMVNIIFRFKKAFYDFIYKSRKQAITSTMFDEIMLTSIYSDLKHDELKDGYHTKETSIKEKLNIWFSLYSSFNNNSKKRENMANTFKTLLEKMELVANDDNILIEENNVGEFLFATGQVIYFLLSKSKTSNPTHALLEPFLQKSNAVQLQNAVANAVNAYKHEISFYKDRFERLAAQVLAFETNENLKNFQRYLLAGYFAPAIIYKSTKEKETSLDSNNN
jgi:CRISPR-associated protein Csh1